MVSELIRWVAILNLNLSSLLDKKLEPFEINSSQFFYIFKVCRNPGMTRERMFQEVYRNPSNISRALTVLEEKGYIRREPNKEDRRTCYLYPTDKAVKTWEKIEKILDECNLEAMEEMSEEEKKIFQELLKKVALKAVWMNKEAREKGGKADE